jgi:hypothetical protein
VARQPQGVEAVVGQREDVPAEQRLEDEHPRATWQERPEVTRTSFWLSFREHPQFHKTKHYELQLRTRRV